ncbi:MAG: DUF2142 domain-containing protein [Candidatus Saccharimonadales bacterium]
MDNLSANFKRIINYPISRPAGVFVFLALIFGSLFIFKLAPLNGTDEFTHFPRVYQISEGVFFERRLPGNQFGGYLPTNVNAMVNDYRNLSRESSGPGYNNNAKVLNEHYGHIRSPGHKKVQSIFTSVVIYPPWAYIAPLVGLIVAKALSLSLIWYVYLARLSALLVWIGLTWLAIRLIPGGKWFMVALALLPTSLSQAATVGADGLLNGLCWLLIAWVFAATAGKVKLSWPKLILLTAISISIATIKDGYFLIGLFPLVIPLKHFPTRLGGKLWKGTTLFLSVGAMVLFTLRTVKVVSGVVLTPTIGMYINSSKQISYILHNATDYMLRVLWQPFTKSFDTTYQGIVGIITNRLIYLSILIMLLLFFNLYLGFVNTASIKALIATKYRLWIVGGVIFVGTYILLATAFYIGNTSVGAWYVNGFYGRYFLPLVPIVLIIPLTIKRKRLPSSTLYKTATIAICTVSLISTIMSLA